MRLVTENRSRRCTKAPVKALLDTSLARLAEVAVSAMSNQSFTLLAKRHMAPVMGWRAKLRLRPDERWKQEQLEAMPTIARLARENRIQLFIYSELENEIMLNGPFPSGVVIDLLKDVNLGRVPAAVERSKWQQMEMRRYLQKGAVIDFCKFLSSLDYAALARHPRFGSFAPKFTDFEMQNMRCVHRLKELSEDLPENHYADALHLWTAEVNALDYFLTCDKKFINALAMSSRVKLRGTLPIAPSKLLDKLGITKLDPLPISDNKFHTFL